MGKPYEPPVVEYIEFAKDDIVTASFGIAKNPGHLGCTVMPNGKPIPENAVGRYGDEG